MLNEDAVRTALAAVIDPEVGLDIVTMGLVYGVTCTDDGHVGVRMTLTSPGCPMGGTIVGAVEHLLARLPGVAVGQVEVVWDPAWTPAQIDPRALARLRG